MYSSPRRILFVLAEPGYFRMYGRTMTEMTRRGWTAAVAFEKPHRRGPSPPLPAGANGDIEVLGRSPHGVHSVVATLRGVIDYLRYLEGMFVGASYLRRRAERYLPAGFRFLTRIRRLPSSFITAAIAGARLIERAMPPARGAREFVEAFRPDVLFVTPLLAPGVIGANQTELVKAGRSLGIPVVVGVASWDHLTSKGLVRVVPDALLVWNEMQRNEAVRLHRIPASRVLVTGAQLFDHWFEPVSHDSIRAFRRTLGIDETRRVLLIVGSSPKMAPRESEVMFVRRWLAAVRSSSQTEVREAFVVVRPHPGNTAPWLDVDLDDDGATIVPRTYEQFPLSDQDVELFRCSLAASSAVIGINTTAMIEAAILRRPVLTVHDAAFDHSQRQTLHFAYLEKDTGGFAISAGSLTEHVAQLEHLMRHGVDLTGQDRFVERFVRPLGIERSATLHVCDAIEAVARSAGTAAHDVLHSTAVSQPMR